MMTFNKHSTTAVLLGLVVAAGISTPAASARDNCEDQGTHTVCQTNGSVSIKAVPDAKGSGLPDPSQRVGSQGRRGCYTDAMDRDHICN